MNLFSDFYGSVLTMKDKEKKKRELIEWIILIAIVSIIYLGGWQTPVIGKLQQVVLSTGIISPDIVDEELEANYNFEIEDAEGGIIDFNEFQGKVVFLNFWATWCPPCIAEMPDINDLYGKEKNVAFVMVSLDRDRQKARDFVVEKEFEFPIYFLKSALPDLYNVSSIPTTYVLSKDGKVKVRNHGMAKYDSKKFRAFLSELQ